MRDPMFESFSRKEERDWNRSELVPNVDACESRRNSELVLVAVRSVLLSLLRDIEVFSVEKSLNIRILKGHCLSYSSRPHHR
jgi:hypothetical protein